VDADNLIELFRDFGPVSVRRMFGGAGVFVDGLAIGLVIGGVIYLKTDAVNAPDFDRENLGAFTYQRQGVTHALTSHRRMPDRLYDDPEELAVWARAAHGAAVRAAARKARPKARSGSKAAIPKAKAATKKRPAKGRLKPPKTKSRVRRPGSRPRA
jgi:DNA transformation protein